MNERFRRPGSGIGALRATIANALRATLGGDGSGLEEYASPIGDPGLFGEGSVVWRVHADLPGMLIGGLSSLMLQSLHPLAMAGVAQHSRYRDDPIGRLRRTARFVAGTTFGAMPFVEHLLGEVREVHHRVEGVAPDGRPYSANDPELVTFVHTAEVFSFLNSYERYGPSPLTMAEKDAYLDEVAVLASLLGAKRVPRSLAEVRRYLHAIEHELVATKEARQAVEFLRGLRQETAAERVAFEIVLAAAIDLLPSFARRALHIPRLPLVTPATTRPAAHLFSSVVRWSLGPSIVEAIAADRVHADRSASALVGTR